MRVRQDALNWLKVTVTNFYKNVHLLTSIYKKCMDSLQEAFIHTPEPCDARFIMDAHFLFDVLWTVEQKASTHCNDNAWRGQDHFLYNSYCINLKEESHTHLCLVGVKTRLIFFFRWTYPLS